MEAGMVRMYVGRLLVKMQSKRKLARLETIFSHSLFVCLSHTHVGELQRLVSNSILSHAHQIALHVVMVTVLCLFSLSIPRLITARYQHRQVISASLTPHLDFIRLLSPVLKQKNASVLS